MSKIIQPDDLGAIFDGIESRLRILETSTRVPNISTSRGIQFDKVDASESTSSATYVDLATVGPTVSGIQVSPLKTLLIWISAKVLGAETSTAYMSVYVEGGTIDAYNYYAASDDYSINSPGGLPIGTTRLIILENLIPGGTYTVTAKYRKEGPGATANFTQRSMVVIPL